MQRGRDRQPTRTGTRQPATRSESRRLSRRPTCEKSVAHKPGHCQSKICQGDTVHVFSRSADKWVDAEVAKFEDIDFVRVEYKLAEYWCGKTVHLNSEHIAISRSSDDYFSEEVDPESNFASVGDAYQALRDNVTVRWVGGHPESVTKALDLESAQNNTFVTMEPLTVDCMFEYRGLVDEDVLLKIYTLESQYPRNDYGRYVLHDYVHAMQQPRDAVNVKAGCFVGFVVHRDLNQDWLWKMKAEDPQKYQNFISRSSRDGYQGRGDPIACTHAVEADYLISFTTADKIRNDELLRRLSAEPIDGPHGEGPCTFCTDRSLGFGGHFDAPRGLYLAKHGFGQPVAQGAWFHEYAAASKQTRCGVLILNPSDSYFKSAACMREYREIGLSKLWVYRKPSEQQPPATAAAAAPRCFLPETKFLMRAPDCQSHGQELQGHRVSHVKHHTPRERQICEIETTSGQSLALTSEHRIAVPRAQHRQSHWQESILSLQSFLEKLGVVTAAWLREGLELPGHRLSHVKHYTQCQPQIFEITTASGENLDVLRCFGNSSDSDRSSDVSSNSDTESESKSVCDS